MPRKKLTQEERVARMSQKVVDTMRQFGLPNVADDLEEKLKRKREADVPLQVDVETTLEIEDVGVMAICECGNEVIGEHPVCSICGTLIHHPLEKIVYGTEKGIQFHDDCYLAEMGFPEELIDHIEIIQKGDQITTVIDMTGEIPEDVEE